MNYFKNCRKIEEAKKEYRKLLKIHHPDVGGNEETCKEIIKQFNRFSEKTIETAFEELKYSSSYDINDFKDILNQIISYNCEIEIIGFWIYCRKSFHIRKKLADLGFWFSSKHKAWIYNGEGKKLRATRKSIEDIRSKYGSRMVSKIKVLEE